MKNLFNPDTFLMRFLSKVADMMLLNALWLISCIPVITIGAATTAVYHVVLKIAAKEEPGIFRTYWIAFRDNFWQATKVFLILLIPLLLVAADMVLLAMNFLGDGLLIKMICGLPAIMFAIIWAYAYPLTAKFQNTAFATVKNALLLGIANLPRSVVIVVLNLFPLVWLLLDPLTFTRCFVIFLLGGFAWIAYGNAFLLNKVFAAHLELSAENVN